MLHENCWCLLFHEHAVKVKNCRVYLDSLYDVPLLIILESTHTQGDSSAQFLSLKNHVFTHLLELNLEIEGPSIC